MELGQQRRFDAIRSPPAAARARALANVRAAMRRPPLLFLLVACALLAGCGATTTILGARRPPDRARVAAAKPVEQARLPGGRDQEHDAGRRGRPGRRRGRRRAGRLSVGRRRGRIPPAVALAPTDDWQAAIASSVLMAPPIRAPILLSGSALAAVGHRADAFEALAPTGSGAAGGAQVIRVGDVPRLGGMRTVVDPRARPVRARRRDRPVRQRRRAVGTSPDVVIASADSPRVRDARGRLGGRERRPDPVRDRAPASRPPTGRRCWRTSSPHIYVLGPPSVIPDACLPQLRKYGTVKRVGASDPAANSVAFAELPRSRRARSASRAPTSPAASAGRCASPGHGYVLINASRTLDAAAAAPLSASGDYGPELLVDDSRYACRRRCSTTSSTTRPRLHPGGPDRGRLQPRLGDRRPAARSRSRSRPRWTTCSRRRASQK